jgi:uncharacterized protein YaaQ
LKLALCIVHNRDRSRITDELVKAGFKFTVIGSTGGFLREGNTTILIGTEAEQVSTLQKLIGEICKSRDQLVNVMPFGGAVMFVMPVEQFHRF